ncbi:MAG: response regulator [Beijerinckiaceae bacterium]|nr:response regulator [Beijerinckiaceae bacterium]MDO9440110.1 response regulator [Beijerinckiaceae bacterium]
MARAAVNWSLDQLAVKAGVHRNTIHNFESGRYSGSPEKLRAVRMALQGAGVEFIDGPDASGVRLRSPVLAPESALLAAGVAGAVATHRVLVVDSAPEVRSLARSILEELSLSVVEAESGEEALMILQDKAVGLSAVFSDVTMPGMDGVILANIIMKTWPAIKVILSTGAATVSDLNLPGNAEVIAKPWRISEMFRLFRGI